eukprot:6491466-Amphidinium_carterae.3
MARTLEHNPTTTCFTRLNSDACVFANKESIIYIMAYIDDLLVVGDNATTEALQRLGWIMQGDAFIPTTADQDNGQHLWWMWLSEPQYNRYARDGSIPGYQEVKGEIVHKHHRLHDCPDHCINLAMHTRWNVQFQQPTIYTIGETPHYLSVWRKHEQCVGTIRLHGTCAQLSTEDISIEFNPLYNCPTVRPIAIRALLGRTLATWRIVDWSRPDNQANNALWLDHALATWMTTPTHWHLNWYTAVTMQ